MQVSFYGNLRGSPEWLADFTSRDKLSLFPVKLDPAQFNDAGGVNVAVGASAAQNATSVTVAALTPSALANTTVIAAGGVLIPSGTTLYFGGAKVATLTADAKIGDTTLTVAALPTALAGTETATFSRYGTILVPSGTFVSRTFAQRDSNTPFGPANLSHDEFGLTYADIADLRTSNDAALVRPGAGVTVKENYLPQYATLTTAGNAVDTVAISGSLSAGTFTITVNGVGTGPIAYNANLAAIQAALDAAFGTNGVVAAGTVAAHTLTYSGTGYANTSPVTTEDISGLTGATKLTVTRSTAAGSATLAKIRQLFNCIKGTN